MNSFNSTIEQADEQRRRAKELLAQLCPLLDAFNEPGMRAVVEIDWDRIVAYRNIKGERFESPVWQIVLHVVNHASYHRGQVTTMLRQLLFDTDNETKWNVAISTLGFDMGHYSSDVGHA